LDDEILSGILAALETFRDDENCRVVILSGAGGNFSTGGDLSMVLNGLRSGVDVYGREEFLMIARIVKNILTYPKPIIAMVHGYAAGMACNIAFACDIIIAAEDAKFLQPFINIGAAPDGGGVYILSKIVGVNKAKELIMLGEAISAIEAKNLGLISRVVEPANLEVATDKIARKFAAGPTLAFAKTKELIYLTLYKDIDEYFIAEQQVERLLSQSRDFVEGMEAFLEKRTPNFVGK
jgi:enoyl-CoA hydratase/carnithine racemase